MDDPDQFCIRCGRSYGATEESCSGCGFDPVNDPDDEIANDEARQKFKEMKDGT